ncbi:MAG: phytoene/squalene synthase family protein [Actinobacteria bacterium]|nr:phytoene/squalene synthase family protein [Actinomycetota bacterium]
MNSQDLDRVSLEKYSRAAIASSREVIRSYSTSFGLATNLLAQPIRSHVQNIYALVRVADEIVDGAAAGALGSNKFAAAGELNKLEQETYKAMNLGFSTNLVVHAFARTAIETGISRKIVEPFYYSMRLDLQQTKHDKKSFDKYVYGSAEVIGLMCLQAFIQGKSYSQAELETLRKGAQALGAAFQKVNFLRDLAQDFEQLGRSYFPNLNVKTFDEGKKLELVEDIKNDLRLSAKTIPLLPKTSSKAVVAAQLLFTALNNKIERTPATEIIKARIRVSDFAKALILFKAWIGVRPR